MVANAGMRLKSAHPDSSYLNYDLSLIIIISRTDWMLLNTDLIFSPVLTDL
jgi:hypothetical protein